MPSPVTTLTDASSDRARSSLATGGSPGGARRHAVGGEVHHVVELLLRRQRAAPERVAQAEEMADPHHRPGALFGVALRELAALGRFLQRLRVALGQLVVVIAEGGFVDELRLLHNAIHARM